MGLTTVTAAEKEKTAQGEDLKLNSRYGFEQPIQFVERGIEFLIFPDGTFDFNTNIEGNHYNNHLGYYRKSNSRRGSINATFGAPGTRVKYSRPRNRGVIVTHDYNGRVRRIGNVFVNYNRFGQVKRLGSVYISYNHRSLIKQIGGLHIKYDRRGQIIRLKGHVNYSNQGCGICGMTSCNVNHFDTHIHNDVHYENDWDENDDDFYYYKNGKKGKKHKK